MFEARILAMSSLLKEGLSKKRSFVQNPDYPLHISSVSIFGFDKCLAKATVVTSSMDRLVDGNEINDIKKGRDSLFAVPFFSACRSAVILTRRGNSRIEVRTFGCRFLFVETKLNLVMDRPFRNSNQKIFFLMRLQLD